MRYSTRLIFAILGIALILLEKNLFKSHLNMQFQYHSNDRNELEYRFSDVPTSLLLWQVHSQAIALFTVRMMYYSSAQNDNANY